MAPSSRAEKSFSAPTYSVMGVRAPPRMKTSCMVLVSSLWSLVSGLWLLESLQDRFAGFLRAKGAADVLRHVAGLHRAFDGALDARRVFSAAERFEHQRRRQDGANWIGHVLPRQW